jgi:hypothetical protein
MIITNKKTINKFNGTEVEIATSSDRCQARDYTRSKFLPTCVSRRAFYKALKDFDQFERFYTLYLRGWKLILRCRRYMRAQHETRTSVLWKFAGAKQDESQSCGTPKKENTAKHNTFSSEVPKWNFSYSEGVQQRDALNERAGKSPVEA